VAVLGCYQGAGVLPAGACYQEGNGVHEESVCQWAGLKEYRCAESPVLQLDAVLGTNLDC
jgi:hypothetical protein